MPRTAPTLPHGWTPLARSLGRAFGRLVLDEYHETFRVEDGVRSAVQCSTPQECADAWASRVSHQELVTLVDVGPTNRVTLTAAPLAQRRYAFDVPLDEHCSPFAIQVTVTTAGTLDVATTLAGKPPTHGALVALIPAEGLSIELRPDCLVCVEAPHPPKPTDHLPTVEELLRCARPHFDELAEPVIADAHASLEHASRTPAALRGRVAEYLAYDLGRGLSFREGRRDGDTASLTSLALAELERHGASPRTHRPRALVGEYAAERRRQTVVEPGTQRRLLAADGTFEAEGALAEFVRWQAAYDQREVWLYRLDGTREVLHHSGRRYGDKAGYRFEWRQGHWLERWS